VGHQQNGGAVALVQFDDEGVHIEPREGVKGAEGLVEK